MAPAKVLKPVFVSLFAASLLMPLAPAEAAPPSNDDFDNATVVGSLPYSTTIDTTEATSSPDDPVCDTGGGHTVWYRFAPGSNMRIQASTMGSDYDTVLSIWTGTRNGLALVACRNNDAYQGESFTFDASKTTYHFMVAASGIGSGGSLAFGLRTFPPATNDDFANATDITDLPVTDSLNSTGATTAPDDPFPSCSPRAKTVWYTITPARKIRVELDSLESWYDTNLSVYTGPRGGLIEIACNDSQQYFGMAKLGFDAEAGVTYHIMLASWESGPGGEWVLAAKQGQLTSPLGLTLSKNKVSYKVSVKVTAHLGAFQDTDNDVVKIYKTEYGGPKTLVASGNVNAQGDLSVNVPMLKNTTFVAEWDGEPRYAPAVSSVKTVKVYVLIATRLLNSYGSSGKFRLYHYTPDCPKHHKGCPTYRAVVSPNHAGQKVYFDLQVFVGGRWRLALSFGVRLSSKSKAVVIFIYRDRSVINVPTRAHVRFNNDADHLGRTSPWAYFKVTA